jgi:Domain of unknown function (DUF3482)/50S ribosome-binding GTPase
MSVPTFAVVGHPNKGKSSIVSTLAQDDSVRIAPEPGTTVVCRAYPMRVDGEVLYVLVDTPGFQRARRALEWMRARETHAGAHRAVVEAFVAEHRAKREFPDECELLTPVLAGAGILYVADGARPYGPDFEAEMEILRWTGQPSMALVNPIGGSAHVEEWRAALSQYFKIVRVFDAHAASFEARLELLRGFGQLAEEWRAPLETAVAALAGERERVHARVARAIAELLAEVLTYTAERRIPVGAHADDFRESLEREWQDALRARERAARRAVEQIYGHRAIEREERPFDLLEQDLFSVDHWFFWGLSRRQLVASGAAGGAAVGGVIDAVAHGASLLAGAVIGAAVGGAGAWWSSHRLARVRVFALPLGGQLLRCGPAASPNFPYVVLGRALYHHALVAGRTHAVRSPLALGEGPTGNWIERLEPAMRRELDRTLRALRRDRADAADALARALVPIVARGDAPDDQLTVSAL